MGMRLKQISLYETMLQCNCIYSLSFGMAQSLSGLFVYHWGQVSGWTLAGSQQV